MGPLYEKDCVKLLPVGGPEYGAAVHALHPRLPGRRHLNIWDPEKQQHLHQHEKLL